MKIVRLLRRVLLCAVVGLTAFGISGYLLRPTPTWTIYLGPLAKPPRVACPLHPATGADAVWVVAESETDHDKVHDGTMPVWRLDPKTGAILQHLDVPDSVDGYSRARDDGRLLMVRDLGEGRLILECQVALIGPRDQRAPPVHIVKGDWYVSDDGKFLYRVRELHSGLEVERIAIDDDWMPRRTALGPRYTVFGDLRHHCVSPDARLLSLTQRIRTDAAAPFGVELWNLDAGVLVKTLHLPPTPEIHQEYLGPSNFKFSKDGTTLFFSWLTDAKIEDTERWRWDLHADNAVPVRDGPAAPPPVPQESRWSLDRVDDAAGRESWASTNADHNPACWFSVDQGARQLTPWRRYPYVIPPRKRHDCDVSDYSPHFELIPNAAALVVACSDPSLATALPGPLRRFLPAEWKSELPISRVRWHDWERNAWLDVGCSVPDASYVRPDAYLAMNLEDGRAVLSSWPLPPRDPRPLAAVIAVCSSAAVWVFCSWRSASRRISRQSETIS